MTTLADNGKLEYHPLAVGFQLNLILSSRPILFNHNVNTSKVSSIDKSHLLTLIWVGFLGVCFEMKGGGVKLPLSKTHWSYARNLKFGT